MSRWVLAPEFEGQLWATGHERQGQCVAAEAVDFFRPTLQVYVSIEGVGRFTAETQTQKIKRKKWQREDECVKSWGDELFASQVKRNAALDPARDELIQKFKLKKVIMRISAKNFWAHASRVALQRCFPARAHGARSVVVFIWKRPARKVMMLLLRSFLHRPDIYLLPAKIYTKWNIAINAHEISQSAAPGCFLPLSLFVNFACQRRIGMRRTHSAALSISPGGNVPAQK